jgi:hypothetical protein
MRRTPYHALRPSGFKIAGGLKATAGAFPATAIMLLLLLQLTACGNNENHGQADNPPVDQSKSLNTVLENGALSDACARYRENPASRNLMLKCGKYMFFYESFDTPGVPLPLLQTLMNNLPEHVGAGFEKLGYIRDPYSTEQLPLGFGKTFSYGSVEARAFTCAACHFAQAADGTYVVGLANHGLDYGTTLLDLMIVPMVATGIESASKYDAEVIAKIQPTLDWIAANDKTAAILADMITVGQGMANSPSPLSEVLPDTPRLWTLWQPGVLDFFTSPFPEDEYHVPIRIPSLWEIPTAQEVEQRGLPHAMLSAAGGGDSMWSFIQGFIATSRGEPGKWTDDDVRPIVEYIYSLQHPINPQTADAQQIADGQRIFEDAGCADCHNGKSYGGSRVFSFEEIGTDATLKYFSDPDLDGVLCCDLELLGDSELTHGLKAPHLSGIWTHRVFLHNGSVASLEELLCHDGPRPAASSEQGMGNGGHEFGCDLPTADKDALLAFLRSI